MFVGIGSSVVRHTAYALGRTANQGLGIRHFYIYVPITYGVGEPFFKPLDSVLRARDSASVTIGSRGPDSLGVDVVDAQEKGFFGSGWSIWALCVKLGANSQALLVLAARLMRPTSSACGSAGPR